MDLIKDKIRLADAVIELHERKKNYEHCLTKIEDVGSTIHSLLDYFPQNANVIDKVKFKNLFDSRNRSQLALFKSLLTKLPSGEVVIKLIENLISEQKQLVLLQAEYDESISSLAS